ncbi:Transmembrane proteins 14C [Seminavis robusta]|uniref:Transmembrane proteins 14C n=1 Tax=Seminavis robusta TaxID=568900 RepID=A0A9N8DG70_9STRA|nr:Transmembrane proteins 14C [Seminavis robusta]|eukprot:Sro135_g063820.1 Transmembrane proteins 14C (117) ;mRNA; f:64035-64572
MAGIPGSAHLNLSLGGLVMLGGAMGYVKKGSAPSLVAGVAFGSMLIGSGYIIAKTDSQYEGHALATGASGIMALGMAQRYMKTGKMMPAGIVAILGAAACAYNAKKSMEWAPSKSD